MCLLGSPKRVRPGPKRVRPGPNGVKVGSGVGVLGDDFVEVGGNAFKVYT